MTGFSAQIGDTRIDAIVDEKEEANAKYEEAKAAGVQAWKLDKVQEEGKSFSPFLWNFLACSSILTFVTMSSVRNKLGQHRS